MKWFYNLKIGQKILGGFILIAIITAVVGYVGTTNIKNIQKADQDMYKVNTAPMEYITNLVIAYHSQRVRYRDMIIDDNMANKQQYAEEVEKWQAEMMDNLQKLENSSKRADFLKECENLRRVLDTYDPIRKKVMNLALEEKKVEAYKLLRDPATVAINKEIRSIVDKMNDIKVESAKMKSDNNTEIANSATFIMVSISLGALILALALGFFISRLISLPLKKVAEAAVKISERDVQGLNLVKESKVLDETGMVAQGMQEIIDSIYTYEALALKIANGDPNINFAVKSERDMVGKNFNIMAQALKDLLAEMEMLVQAAVEGKLAARGNVDKFQGGYRTLVQGVNQTLDAVVGPLNVAADYLDRISKGNIPEKITDNYNGDFNQIKNNLNICIDSINFLVKDANMLSQAAVEGKLTTRADANKHQGDFRKIVEGVNNTLDAVIKPVQEAASVLQEMQQGNLEATVKGDYQGDHAVIKNALNDSILTIRSYIKEISDILGKMAKGDLLVGIEREYRGDFVQIKNAINSIANSLNEVLGEIRMAADQVASGSRQVSISSQNLSQGSTEQASSLEEVSASITQIAAQTKQNAQSASQGNELAIAAQENAIKGNGQMKEMLESMSQINEASTNISKIIKVIDEIAFQTNILSLNAAVEAARAGQHGKGFAVVAEEVRNLAARSSNAAKETTLLIEGSVEKVQAGTKIANETAGALNDIVDGVSRVAELVAEIAQASNEQANGIAQVNQAINQVDQVVQMTTSTAEESAAASEELSGQAELLKEMVGRFKLKDTQIRYGRSQSINQFNKADESVANMQIVLDDQDFGKY